MNLRSVRAKLGKASGLVPLDAVNPYLKSALNTGSGWSRNVGKTGHLKLKRLERSGWITASQDFLASLAMCCFYYVAIERDRITLVGVGWCLPQI